MSARLLTSNRCVGSTYEFRIFHNEGALMGLFFVYRGDKKPMVNIVNTVNREDLLLAQHRSVAEVENRRMREAFAYRNKNATLDVWADHLKRQASARDGAVEKLDRKQKIDQVVSECPNCLRKMKTICTSPHTAFGFPTNKRRKACDKCDYRTTTLEIPFELGLRIYDEIKAEGDIDVYNRN